jgi:tetratricopeptide (TPR) repeat protein
MFPPHHRRRRGWFAPVLRFFDQVGYSWWKMRRSISRFFQFRWLTSQLSRWGHSFMNGARYPFHLIGWLLRQFWTVLVAWWQIRNFRYLVQGLPALAAIVVVAVIGTYTLLRSEDGLQEMYSRNAMESLVRGERSKAQLCYERLMILQPTNDPKRQETMYRLALICLETAIPQYQRARALITALANPETSDGYPDAHVYAASEIMTNAAKLQNPEQRKLAEQHLRRALQKNPDHQDANRLLGTLLTYQYRTQEAIPFLQKTDPRDRVSIDARIKLAEIYKLDGKNDAAQQALEQTIDFLRNRSRNEFDDVRYRLALSQAYLVLEEFEKAIEILQEGMRMKKNEFYRIQLSNCYLRWYERLTLTPSRRMPTPENEMNRLNLIINALKIDPNNATAIKYLVNFMSRSGSDANARAQAHRDLLARDGRNAFLRLWMGEKLLVEGKLDEARKEWELAYEYNPDSPTIANNFAWILTFGQSQAPALTPDLQRALRIINQVIDTTPKEYPNRPQFHGTRGTIYLKMGRYKEALEELLLAAQRPNASDDPILQEQLMLAYDRLGMHEASLNHRKLLAEIQKRIRDQQAAQATQGGTN